MSRTTLTLPAGTVARAIPKKAATLFQKPIKSPENTDVLIANRKPPKKLQRPAQQPQKANTKPKQKTPLRALQRPANKKLQPAWDHLTTSPTWRDGKPLAIVDSIKKGTPDESGGRQHNSGRGPARESTTMKNGTTKPATLWPWIGCHRCHRRCTSWRSRDWIRPGCRPGSAVRACPDRYRVHPPQSWLQPMGCPGPFRCTRCRWRPSRPARQPGVPCPIPRHHCRFRCS